MPFTDAEIVEYTALVEQVIWSRRRPPLHLRDKIREGQRIVGNEVELFMVRPAWNDPTHQIESSIAKARYVRSRNVWRIFWKRADGKWHGYAPFPETNTFREFLELVAEDAKACFWG